MVVIVAVMAAAVVPVRCAGLGLHTGPVRGVCHASLQLRMMAGRHGGRLGAGRQCQQGQPEQRQKQETESESGGHAAILACASIAGERRRRTTPA